MRKGLVAFEKQLLATSSNGINHADVRNIFKKFDYFFLSIASTVDWSKFIITLLILFETKDRP